MMPRTRYGSSSRDFVDYGVWTVLDAVERAKLNCALDLVFALPLPRAAAGSAATS